MPTYEYECETCGATFERRQTIAEAPLAECPNCHGKVRRLVSGGAGFILKGPGRRGGDRREKPCSFEREGTTCCGRTERCGKSCGE